jgi:glutamine amidotransferase
VNFVIVDFGLGNLRTIQHKLMRIGIDSKISADPRDVEQAQVLVLPGVGHFGTGMNNLRQRGLIPVLNRKVLEEHTPIMGICLGMQLLSEWSEEGDVAGLGWIKGRTRRFRFDGLATPPKVPHVGWNTLMPVRSSPLLEGIPQTQRFYFTHSYHVCCSQPEDVLTTTNYGYDFVSVIHRDNIFGTQFHPEKSHRIGMEIMRNFIACHATLV